MRPLVCLTLIFCTLCLGAIGAVAAAQPSRASGPLPEQRQVQERIARESARRELWFTVRRAEIVPGLPVSEFLDAIGQPGLLDDTVSKAEIIGGPRWLTADICQFHLQLDGSTVGELLHDAAGRPRSPLTPEQVWAGTRHWLGRPFVSTGCAINVDVLNTVAPPADQVIWRGISKESREAAIKSAHQKAVQSAARVSTTSTEELARMPVTRLSFFVRETQACVEVELLLPDTGEAFVGEATVRQTPGDATGNAGQSDNVPNNTMTTAP